MLLAEFHICTLHCAKYGIRCLERTEDTERAAMIIHKSNHLTLMTASAHKQHQEDCFTKCRKQPDRDSIQAKIYTATFVRPVPQEMTKSPGHVIINIFYLISIARCYHCGR